MMYHETLGLGSKNKDEISHEEKQNKTYPIIHKIMPLLVLEIQVYIPLLFREHCKR